MVGATFDSASLVKDPVASKYVGICWTTACAVETLTGEFSVFAALFASSVFAFELPHDAINKPNADIKIVKIITLKVFLILLIRIYKARISLALQIIF